MELIVQLDVGNWSGCEPSNFCTNPYKITSEIEWKYCCALKMSVAEMKEDDWVYTDEGNGEEFINEKCVKNIKEFFILKMISISPIAESATVRKVIEEQVSFSYGMKEDCLDLDEARDFDQANSNNYFGSKKSWDAPLQVQ